jgi:hypothetical protein
MNNKPLYMIAVAIVVGASIVAVPQLLWVPVVLAGLGASIWLATFACKLGYALLFSTRDRRTATIGLTLVVACILLGVYMQDAQHQRNIASMDVQWNQCQAGEFDSNWAGRWSQTYNDPDFAKLTLKDQQSVYWGIRKEYCDKLADHNRLLGHADELVKNGGMTDITSAK